MMIRCYEITPHPDSEYDALVLPAGRTWKPIMDNIEWVLEELYSRQDDPDKEDWTKIQATIKCVWYEEDDLYEMGYLPSDLNSMEAKPRTIRYATRPQDSKGGAGWD